MQKKLTILFVFAIFVLLVGWAITPAQAHCKAKGPHSTDEHCNEPPPDDGGGGSGKFSVDVTFDDSDCGTDEVGRDRFCSDGFGPYVDGNGDVAAVGDKFRFSLTLQSGTTRKFFLDFKPGNCVSAPATCATNVTPSLEGGTAGFTSLGSSQNVFSTGEASSLLDMIVSDPPTLRDFSITFNDSVGDSWVVLFNPSQCNDNLIDLVPVTRTGQDTWVFEATDEVACLQQQVGGHGPKTLYGRYTVPFKLFVTRKP